ncbi:MAG TPA: carbohydrate kinase family protein [Candidatus Sulfotelmatobacter sp.]|nr:carbohydrate kinase family protein [Candidatus Sulfotelmatobacter sp.]
MPRFDVTIAGELNLDLILYGLPEQLPPERELLADRMMLTLGSSSAIVAHNLSALGSRVGFQSRIGDDPLGQIALDRLQQGGVDVSRVRCVPGSTTTGLSVILHHDSWRNILTYAGTIAELSWDDLDLDYLADSRHFHLSSYYLQRGLRPQVGELFQGLKSRGLTISLDTNDDPDDQWEGGLQEILRHVDVFLPNEREACKAAGLEDLEAAIHTLSGLVPLVVVKLGRKGAMAQRGSDCFTSPALEVVPVDSVGAGDSFDAGFLHQYVRGSNLPTCLASGNLAGALSTTRPGGTEAFRDGEHKQRFFQERG